VETRTIDCRPQGICSWNYSFESVGSRASIRFHWGSEQGCVVLDAVEYPVRKRWFASGRWTLESGAGTLAEARKASVFHRGYRVEWGDGQLLLEPVSVFQRGFALARQGSRIAVIEPVHPFTRRATITTRGDEPDPLLLRFSLWLVVLAWRRQQSN